MQEPSKYDNASFNHGYPEQGYSPPPPYYPPAPVPTAPPPGLYYPTAPGPPGPIPYGQPYYPGAPAPQQPLICQQQSTNVVVVNPQAVMVRPRHQDYLCWSIINFVFCCWPLGLIAMIFSCKTRCDDDRGDQSTASCSSKTALSLNIISLIMGVILYIILAVVYSQR